MREVSGTAGWSHGAQIAAILACCLALSALSLLYPSTPTYDPWAWILWGREILHLDLVTEGGPSWKPFPILFTVPFSVFGQDAAPYLWLWVARAGGLFGCVMAYRMANRLSGGRLYGATAGVCAFAALLSSNKFVRDAALGNSDPMLGGIVLWAFERHLDGRRDHALYLGVVAALMRPEAWPFLALYGLWLWFSDPRLRTRLVAFAVLVPAVWFLPEWWGSGDPLRAGSRANAPNPGSAAFDDIPAVAVLRRFVQVTIAPVELGTLVAVGYAVVCVLGGMGAVRVLQGVEWVAARWFGPRRAPALTAAALLLGVLAGSPTIVAKANNEARVRGGLEHEAYLWHDLKGLIDEAGGKAPLLACSGVFSGPFQTQMVAYELGIHGIQVGWKVTPPPGVVFRTRTVPDGPLVSKPTDDRYRLVATNGKWRLLTVPPEGRTDCPKASPDAPSEGTAGNVATKDAPLEVIGDPQRPQGDK